MKTAELTGAALEWAVAKCEGVDVTHLYAWDYSQHKYSTDWAQGGPIIEREQVSTVYRAGGYWLAYTHENYQGRQADADADTPLIAAMRCYVASKLGGEVEIPKELLTK